MDCLIENGYEDRQKIAKNSSVREQDCKMITFIDSKVIQDLNYVVNSISGSRSIVIVRDKPNGMTSLRDGIEQITEILQEHNNIQSIQIIASLNNNGDSIKLGLTELNIHTLEHYKNDLQQWKNALADAAEILIFSGLVLSESLFQNFISQLARITSADIGAFVTIPNHSQENHPEHEFYSLIVAWQ